MASKTNQKQGAKPTKNQQLINLLILLRPELTILSKRIAPDMRMKEKQNP